MASRLSLALWQPLSSHLYQYEPKRLPNVLISACRSISFYKINNKKITRLESDIEIEDPNFKSRLINRNPRNLEQMSFEHKPQGFWLEKKAPHYWYKLVLEKNGKHLDAALVHWSGRKVVQASTKEKQLEKYFKGINTRAAILLAKIIVRRCLQSGYITAASDFDPETQADDIAKKSFYETAVESGMTLEEMPPIQPRTVSDL